MSFAGAQCWISYVFQQWNSDYTALVNATVRYGTAATFLSSTGYSCVVTDDAISTLVSVQLSYETTSTYPPSSYFIPNTRPLQIQMQAPAPMVVATFLDDSGTYVVIVFDVPVAFLVSSLTCDSVFVTQPKIASLGVNYAQLSAGNATDCAVTVFNDYTIGLSFSTAFVTSHLSTAANVNMLIRFQSSVVVASQFVYAQSLSGDSQAISAPQFPTQPSVSIVLPSFVGICTDLVIDMTNTFGSGNRYFSTATYVAQLINVGSGASLDQTAMLTNIQSLLAGFARDTVTTGNLYFTIPNAILLASAQLRITATLTNYIGAQAIYQTTTTISVSQVIPSATIDGPAGNSVSRDTPFSLIGDVIFPSASNCASQASTDFTTLSLFNQWSLVAPAEYSAIVGNVTVSELDVPSYVLDPGFTYSFSFGFSVISAAGQMGTLYTIPFDVTVTYGSLGCSVLTAGGIVNLNSNLALAASINDATWANDVESALHRSEYSFRWSCQLFTSASAAAKACVNYKTGSTVPLAPVQSLLIPANVLGPTISGGFYVFALTLTHGVSGRNASSNAQVSVVGYSPPLVQISAPASLMSAQDPTFNLQAVVSQSLSAVSDLKFSWVTLAKCGIIP